MLNTSLEGEPRPNNIDHHNCFIVEVDIPVLEVLD